MKPLLYAGAVVLLAAAILYVIHLEMENACLKSTVANPTPKPSQRRIGFA